MNQDTAEYYACKKGDRQAAARLYESMKNILLTYAYGILQDRSLSEDIVHDVFTKILTEPGARDIRDIRPYMISMARNRAKNYIRDNQQIEFVEDMERMSNETVEDDTENEAWTMLRTLPSDEAEAVRLHIDAELTFSDIAKVMKVSVTKAFRLYRRGIKKLRECMSEERR